MRTVKRPFYPANLLLVPIKPFYHLLVSKIVQDHPLILRPRDHNVMVEVNSADSPKMARELMGNLLRDCVVNPDIAKLVA